MAKLADYKILHDHPVELTAGSNNNFLELKWKPPKRFVKGMGQQRPVLTYQIWTHTVSEIEMYFQYNGSLTSGVKVSGGLPSGQLITGYCLVGGQAMGNEGVFRINAGFVGQNPSKFTIDFVKIDYQRRR